MDAGAGSHEPGLSTVAPHSPSALTLGGFLAEIADRYGDRQALVFEGTSSTYASLEQDVRRLARGLIAAGVTKGTRVAVLMANRPEWIIATFAVGMVGGVVIPVNTYGSPAEIEYILRHSDTAVLLLQRELLKHRYLDDLIRAHPEIARSAPGNLQIPALPYLRRIICLDPADAVGAVQSWDALQAMGASIGDDLLDAIAAEVHPSDDAMIIYTSGTTAHPKAVLHMHRTPTLQAWRWAEHLRLTSDDRVWTSFPFFWTAGCSMALGGTLAAGACLVLTEWFDPARVLALIEAERVTTIHAQPHQLAALAEHQASARRDLTSLTRLMPHDPLRRFAPSALVDWDPTAAYGLSETFTIATAIPADAAPAELRQTTHGRPLPGMTVRIVDPETGQPLPTGSLGEITVKGITLMRGYYKTVPEEYLDADGFFHTKDAGWLDEAGFLHWTGRISAMIKTGGANVSPLEVETELARWGQLKSAYAVGVPHPSLGQAVVVCAVRRPDVPVTEDEVKTYLKARLASYKVPKRVLFVDEREITFTGSEKVQLAGLRALAARYLCATAPDDPWSVYLQTQQTSTAGQPVS